jgi:hypothetical protein
LGEPVQEAQPVRAETGPELGRIAAWSGAILALSYPVLAISTGARAAYQIGVEGGGRLTFGPATTGVAAFLYLLAAVGFTLRRRWAWGLSVAVLAVETVMALTVGTASLVWPEKVGSSVWRQYGIDYAFFPLLQPVLGLVWLLAPLTMLRYGIRARAQPRS